MECFLRDLDIPHHGSEIAKSKGMNQKTVSNTLNRLETEGLLKSKTVGKNREFNLNLDDRERVKRFLLALENARVIRFLDEHRRIREVVTGMAFPSTKIVIIFGSYAKANHKKDSDLDILIVGDYSTQETKRISELYGIKVNVKGMNPEGFRQALRKKTIFIREVISDHLIVKGVEDYLELVLSEYYDR